MTFFTYHPGTWHHPRMERQDLTQTQLGSFKFTPTDDLYSLTLPSAPSFAHPFARSQAIETRPVLTHDTTSQNAQASLKNSPTQSRFFTNSSINFNTIVQSSEGEQHLRLRPADLQIAVDCRSTGPEKHFQLAQSRHQEQATRHLQTLASPVNKFEPMFPQYMLPTQQSNRLVEATQYNSVIPPMATQHSFHEPLIVQESLAKALQSEQKAHLVTKEELHTERVKRLLAEAESKRLEDHNRSLLGSVSMLKSIVQHNVRKEQEDKHDNERKSCRNTTTLESKSTIKSGGKQVNSLLHDTMKRQKEHLEADRRKCHPHLEEMVESPKWVSKQTHEDEIAGFFNLDSLQKLVSSENPLVDELIQTLRRHFLVGEEMPPAVMDTSSVSSPPPHKLVDVFPDKKSIRNITEPDANHIDHVHTGETFLSRDRMPKDKQYSEELSPRTLLRHLQQKQPLQATEQPRRGRLDDDNNPERKAIVVQSTVRLENGAADKATHESREKLDNAQYAFENRRNEKLLAMPYNPKPHWVITNDSQVFDDFDDKFDHLGSKEKPEFQGTAFYDHPVRFIPSFANGNLFRTIIMDFIPLGSTYHDVLKWVRGGPLESIQLLSPVAGANDFLTARVVYNYESDARKLYMHGQQPGIVINNQRIRVWQILEPTYPKNKQLECDIFDDGYTRILVVANAPDGALAELPRKVEIMRLGNVLNITYAEDGIPLVEFAKVESAAKAMRELVQDPDFGGAQFDFDDDPCAQEYD